MSPAKICDALVAQYEFEIDIDAPPSRVWKALADQLSDWWLPDFHMLGEDSIVTLEPKPGGRLYEEAGDRGLLWYTVLSVVPNEAMSLAGYCTPEWGGPCSTLLTLRLTASETGTTLSVSDALYGKVSDGQIDSLQSGWRKLFSEGLKKTVESSAL